MPGEGNGVNKGDQRAGWVGGAEKESIEWGSVWDLLDNFTRYGVVCHGEKG